MSSGQTDLTLTAVGDVMMSRRVSTFQDDGFESIVERLRDADVTFANFETLIHDYEGYPSQAKTGTFMRAPLYVAEEIDWCGIDTVAAASNHSFDYSYGGLEATMRELDDEEIPYAGIGENLAEARRPTYVDTPAGRVAVVAACSTITPGSIAGQQSEDMAGRPGLSPMRYNPVYQVPEETYETITHMSEQLGLETRKKIHNNVIFSDHDPDDEELFYLVICGGDSHPLITKGDEFEVKLLPNTDDLKDIVRQVNVARRKADFVVASLHAHEGKGAMFNDTSVPTFAEVVAKNCIDAGADVFVGHGPHTLRGIEMYEGAPILYSLGNFVAQPDLIEKFPPEVFETSDLPMEADVIDLFDNRIKTESDCEWGASGTNSIYWESVVPQIEFDDGEPTRFELHPIELSFEEPRPTKGMPTQATGEKAREILERLRDLSEEYGTEIEIEDGVGVVTL